MKERIFECQNCDWHGAEDATREARDVAQRHEEGDTFSDRECPKCGALVFPRDGAASSAPAPLEPGATPESMAREAESMLRRARDMLIQAGAPRAADKVRAAIKSAGGAVRHAEGKAARQPERGT
ncbi:MAG: hypothetical protein IPK81_14080 [Rhodospirillales bacterium]|nr:MAG: hypothetical protein IPK81_14080 [Rhodospirillales bacterium]